MNTTTRQAIISEANRIMANSDPGCDWRDAGYNCAEDAAEAICGDGADEALIEEVASRI